MAKGLADQQVGYSARADEALKLAQEKIKVIQPEQDLVDALKAFQTSYIKDLAKSSVKERKIADPTTLIDQYTKLEAKWSDLLNKVDRKDANAVAKLLEQELYGKINTDTFVMP